MIGEKRPTLEDHAHRKVRTFLNDQKIIDTDLEFEFWNALYSNVKHMTHTQAKQLVTTMRKCTKTVGDVMEGWKPEELVK